MNGHIYKSFKQYKLQLLVSFLAPFLVGLFFVFLFSSTEDGYDLKDGISEFANEGGMLLRVFFSVTTYYILGMIHSSIYSQDEMKKWAYFVATTPGGTDRQVYIKYLTTFAMCGLTFLGFTFSDAALMALAKGIADVDLPSLSTVYTLMIFVQMLLRSLEIPFYIRYSKKGSVVKTCMFFAVLFIGIVYLLFGPLPGDMDSLTEKLYDFVIKFLNGGASTEIMIGITAFPIIATAMFAGSCKISYRLFMKGVEEYDK